MDTSNVNLLLKKGLFYLSALELAELLYLNKKSNILMEDPFDQNAWDAIRKESEVQLAKGIDILSYGKIWDEDEILLVFTIMINLHLLNSLFEEYKKSYNIKVSELNDSLDNIDFKEPENKRAFSSAIKMLDKNCRIKNWKFLIKMESQ